MRPLVEAVVGTLTFTVVIFSIHATAGLVRTSGRWKHWFESVDFMGTHMQMWNYCYNMIMQGLVFPGLFLTGWARAGFQLLADDSIFPMPPVRGYVLIRCWLYCFAGHLLADCWSERATPFTLIMLHHVACLAGIATFLVDPYGGAMLAAGPLALEWGSLFFTMWCADLPLRSGLYPIPWPRGTGPRARAIVPYAYYIGMTLSNVIAIAALGLVVWANAVRGAWGYAVFYSVVGVALVPLRHQQVVEIYTGKTERPSTPSAAALLSENGARIATLL